MNGNILKINDAYDSSKWQLPDHGYLCEDSYGQLIVVGKPAMRNHRRLHLPEIVSRLEKVRSQIFSDKIGPVLRQMAASVSVKTHAHSACVGLLIAAVCAFFERIKNWFFGNGFRTTVEHALQLADAFDASAALEIDQKPFRRDPNDPDSELIPIRLTEQEIVGNYLQEYSSKINPQECVSIEGSFTYSNAKLASAEIPAGKEGLYNDDAKAVGWRPILNQINRFMEVLKGIGYFPISEYDREIGMHDIAQWTAFSEDVPLDPLDAIELMYRFIQDAYEKSDRDNIHACFFPSSHFFLDGSPSDHDAWVTNIVMKHHDRSLANASNYGLYFAAYTFGEGLDILDPNIQDPHVASLRQKFDKDFGPLLLQSNNRDIAWLAYLVIQGTFSSTFWEHKKNFCIRTSKKVALMPVMTYAGGNNSKVPYAVNVYGYRNEDGYGWSGDYRTKDVFVADPNVGGTDPAGQANADNPWRCCRWQSKDDFLQTYVGGKSDFLMVLSFEMT